MSAVRIARETLSGITPLAVDSIGHCERDDAAGWLIQIDVIESPARMGDNDLLATYAIRISAEGQPNSITRLRRYHREDKDPS